MKFVVSYKLRDGGSVEDRVKGAEAAQKLLANYTPSGTIHQWLQRCDGSGGFAITELDDATALYRDLGVWGPWLEFEAIPVIDIGDAIPLQQEMLQQLQGVL